MVRSPLATRSVSTSKKSSREGTKITRLIIHHTAGGTNEGNVTLLSANNGYDVSAHYVLQTTGRFVSIVPEEYRAWTTGKAADLPSVTVETVNSSGGPDWAVTDAQLESLAQLAADLSKRYGWGKLTRSNVRMHREFIATACPGPYIAARIDQLIARANEIREGAAVKPKPRQAPGTLRVTSWPFGVYAVAKGETVADVCNKFGMSRKRFYARNGVDGFSRFPVGLLVNVAVDYAPLTYQYLNSGSPYTVAVGQVQGRLGLKQTGIYDTKTFTAVADFQDTIAGLARSGRVDRATWDAIFGELVEVKAGDTMWSIAQTNDLTVDELTGMNPRVEPLALQIGKKLRVA